MPLLRIQTSRNIPEQGREALMRALSKAMAEGLGKQEKYVMVTVQPALSMIMSGSDAPSVLGELRSVGSFTGEQTSALSRTLCDLLSKKLDVPTDRIYINFEGVTPTHWGYDGKTFG
jgi:phenylpyruvate tautomerase PptA (4-oxalocrotonate tautomerase family)